MRAYLICRLSGGLPDLGNGTDQQLTYNSYTMAAHLPDYAWAIYMFGGTAAELTAINALPQVYGICLQSELDNVIGNARRTRINNWLAARGWPTIPAGATYRAVLRAIVRRLQAGWDESRIAARDADDMGTMTKRKGV